MKTPKRKRVENREEAYEIMVEGGKTIGIPSRDIYGFFLILIPNGFFFF